MSIFDAFRIARELIALGEAATDIGMAVARLFHRGESPDTIAEVARSRALGLRSGQAGYEAAKNAGPKRS